MWRPTYVAADWAPYRYGRWGWVAPWGWTWIDDARWGFAPFHYGRWASIRHRWCWVPGPRHIRPYYAPALVGWVGGPSVTVSFSSGVGWFPLAPHEVYVPWYRHTPRYVRHVNVSNTTIVNNINVTNVYGRRGQRPRYANSAVANAVTAVQREAFVEGRPVGGHRMQVNDRELRQWRDDVRPGSIAPQRQSILAGQPRRQAPPPAAFAQDNPKRGGDFRATRVAAEQIKRAQATQRNIAPENRVALREPSHGTQSAAGQSVERVQSLRGHENHQNEVRSPSSTQRERSDTPRTRDHMERAPVQALQGSPSTERSSNQGRSNEVRRARESLDPRDTFQGDNSRREVREQPREVREQPREVREQPARQWSQPEPRHAAPVERRAAPVERREAPVERSQPRETREFRSSPPPQRAQEASPPRQNNNQNNNQSSSRSNSDSHSGDGPSVSRDRPNRRPD